MTVGPRSDIGTSSQFAGDVKFGADNIIEGGSTFVSPTIGDHVSIGQGSNIRGTLKDGVQIGSKSQIGRGVFMLEGSQLGNGSAIGDSTVVNAEIKIGSNSCVPANFLVRIDVPDNAILVNFGEWRKVGDGKIAKLQGISCVEWTRKAFCLNYCNSKALDY